MKAMKHVIGVLLFVTALAVLLLLVLQPSILLPAADSAQAQPIDRLFGLHFQMIAVLSAVIVGAMLYSILFFRRKSDEEEPAYEAEDHSLSITWIIFPLGALFFYVLLYSSAFYANFYSSIFPYQEFSFEGFAAIVAAVLGLVLYLTLFILPGLLQNGRPTSHGGDNPADYEHAAKENGRLEMAWTALPLGIVLVFAFIGTGVLRDVLRLDPKALEVRVIGQQWAWRWDSPGRSSWPVRE